MTKEEFVKYVAQFNPNYVTEETAKSIINQAQKVNNNG